MAKLGKNDYTNRNFGLVKFTDANGSKCSLQCSSALDFSHCDDLPEEEAEDCFSRPMLWLGIDKIDAKIMGANGWQPFHIPPEVLLNSRMHLRVDQVKALIADLQTWLETEDFEEDED